MLPLKIIPSGAKFVKSSQTIRIFKALVMTDKQLVQIGPWSMQAGCEELGRGTQANQKRNILSKIITALFTNMRILKFKSQLMIAFFAAVNHLNGPLRKQKINFNGFKRSRFVICDWWISIRFVCFCVSRFVACDRNYD